METRKPKQPFGHTGRMKLVAVFVLASVAVFILASTALRSCYSEEDTSAVRPFPTPVELSIGEQFDFHPKKLSGFDSYHFISGKEGEFWVLLDEMFEPLMAARVTKGTKPSLESISPHDWADVGRVSVTNDDSGNPVVIMMGYVQDAGNTQVVVRKCSGHEWTEPVQLDRFDGSGTLGSMVSLLDSKGRIHVVYDRKLALRESYGIMHGQFPDKCFHASFDGKNWSRARSTTGKGKFYVDPRFLSELPDTKICLGMRVHPFSAFGYKAEYVGYQLWNGERWSSIAEGPPKEAPSGAEGQPVFDYWGNSISRLSKDGRDHCVLKKRGSDSVENVPLLSEPVLKRDRSGRIIICSWDSTQGEIRLWNGDQWAENLSYPLDLEVRTTQILSNPDGNVFLIHKGESRIVIQQIKVTPKKEEPRK